MSGRTRRAVLTTLKALGLTLAVLLVVVAAATAWIVGTQSGSRFALRQAQALLPDGIELGSATGRLGDHLELNGVHVVLEGLELSVARVWLTWSPADLLDGHLEIAELGAADIVYRALPAPAPAEPAEPFALPERIELPVSIHVARVIVDGVEARLAPDAPAQQVRRLLVEDSVFADSRLEVAMLEVDAPGLSVNGRLAATTAGNFPLDANLAWRFDPGDYAPLTGTTILSGSLSRLELEQRIGAPYRLSAVGTVVGLNDVARGLSVDAQVDVDDIRLSEIQPELPPLVLSLTVAADGPVDDLAVTAEVDGSDPEQGRFSALLSAAVTPAAVNIRNLSVRQPDRPGQLSAEGQVALTDEMAADLAVEWQGLQWPLTGEPTLTSPRGRLAVTGPPSGYRLDLQTRLEPAGAPPVDLEVNGSGDLASAVLELRARAGDGTVAGDIDAGWDPVVRGTATLQARNLDPALIAPDWPGRVDLMLEAAAESGGERLSVDVARLDATGTLRGQALNVAVRGRFEQQTDQPAVAVETLNVALGASRLQAQGHLGERADVTWQLESPDLGELLPDARGRVSGAGRIIGPVPQVHLTADLDGDGLAYLGHRLRGLDLEADLDLGGETRSSLTLRADDAVIGADAGGDAAATAIHTLTFALTGTPARHRLDLELDADAGAVELALDGRLERPWQQDRAWHFTFDEGLLGYADLPPWRLQDGGSGSLTGDRVEVARQCWAAAEARACFDGRRDPQDLAANVEVTSLGFDYFAPLLPDGFRLSGALDAYARLSGGSGEPLLAQARVTSSAGELVLPARRSGEDQPPPVIPLEASRIDVDLDASGIRASADLNVQHGRLQLAASTPAVLGGSPANVSAADASPAGATPFGNEPVQARIQVEIPDLSFVSELVPDVEDMAGRVDGDLRVAGTIAAPTLTGALEVEDGSMYLPAPGITVTGLAASVEGLGRDGVAVRAAAASGDGEISIDGRLSLPGQPLEAQLYILGREFQALDNDDGEVLVSPDLTITADAERISVTGTVHVPAAELTPGAQAPSAVAVSEDQVLVSDEPQDAATDRALHAEVRLTLGDEVHLAGFGLTARFEGDVLIDQEPETPTTATGELRILDGEYRAYGQGLVIDSGRVYFAGGPVTEPALDVRAVRRPAEGILVGAHVQGTLQEPSFELFSEPSMTQQEQLSWLVLGRSLEESPEGQESALNRAALAMGLKGGDFLAKNIGEQVGLDDIGIETGSGEAGAPSDPSQAALVVGKYLSPKLYVSYGIGLFDPESVLEMQYEFSRHWTLVTQSSGDATGADVLYTVEVGGN